MVGAIQRIGHGDNNTLNLRILIPFRTMQQYFPPLNVDVLEPLSFLNYQPQDRALHEASKLAVHKVVARNHGFDYRNPDAFDEWDTIRTVDNVGKIFDAMNMFLGSVGLVTLALGAIGIINIMLVAVADRTREIGFARPSEPPTAALCFNFLLKELSSLLLSGGIGMAGAAALMAALSTLPSPPGWDPPKLVPLTAVLAIGALAVAGVVAGLYPARSRGLAAAGRGAAQGIEMNRDLLEQAFGAMRHDLRKTILTMLGMAWGIATVVLLLAYGEGFGQAINSIFQSFGDKAVGIFPGRTSQQAGGNKAGVQVRLTEDDIELLRNVVPLIRHISRQSDKDCTGNTVLGILICP